MPAFWQNLHIVLMTMGLSSNKGVLVRGGKYDYGSQ